MGACSGVTELLVPTLSLFMDKPLLALRTPGVDQTLEADYCYLGGHEYILSTDEYNILVANGYGANITAI